MRNANRALVVAGEASGDMHAANLIREMKRIRPEMSFFGIGGDRMRAAGVDLTASVADLSVVGFTEVISKLGAVKAAMAGLYKETVRRKPGVVVLVDYPGFNLRFAKLVRNLVPKMVYYIGPQVWAWGGWRAKAISSLFDALISVMPFECKIYSGSRLSCHFVGHPVLDLVNPSLTTEEFRSKHGLSDGVLVGLVPGSRGEEVKRILPVMLQSASRVRQEVDNVSFAVSVAETIEAEMVQELCNRLLPVARVVDGFTHDLMQASDLLMVASGTATLEAAVLAKPMSIVYKMSPITWAVAKGLIKVRSVGLANIIAGRRVVPEFIQFDATPQKISAELISLLKDRGRLAAMEEDLRAVRSQLGDPGASTRAARIIVEIAETC
jgi:lipid-A-disaccharide synthase